MHTHRLVCHCGVHVAGYCRAGSEASIRAAGGSILTYIYIYIFVTLQECNNYATFVYDDMRYTLRIRTHDVAKMESQAERRRRLTRRRVEQNCQAEDNYQRQQRREADRHS